MGKTSVCEQCREEILEMNLSGIPRKTIAQNLGLSERAVQAWLQRRKAPSRSHKERLLKIDKSELGRLLDKGLTHREIAQRLGVHESTVERNVPRYGLASSRTGPRSGSGHKQQWDDGRILDKYGYVLIFDPLHPLAQVRGYVLEHRLVQEIVLGRYLKKREVVDHIDGHPRHNWPSNLQMFGSNARHLKATLSGREKATPRKSIPHAYRSKKRLPRCPGEHETLAQCPEEIRVKIRRHIEIHRPTLEHRTLPRQLILRSGAHQRPFG